MDNGRGNGSVVDVFELQRREKRPDSPWMRYGERRGAERGDGGRGGVKGTAACVPPGWVGDSVLWMVLGCADWLDTDDLHEPSHICIHGLNLMR